jgi:cytochrome c-type biogenesis protein CcmH
MLALLLAAIVFAVTVFVLLPLLRPRSAGPAAGEYDQAVYRDQLRELDRDVGRGVLTEAEAASARLEVQRRLLAASAMPVRAARTGRSPVVATVVVLIVVGGSVGLYLRMGAPAMPDMPFASRTIDTRTEQIAQALVRLKQAAEAEPKNAQAWLNYGRALGELSQWSLAADALKHAIDLGQDNADIMAAYGELLTLSAGGSVVPAARAAFASALAKNPTQQTARYYSALATGQDGNPAKAIEMLQALLADLPADAPERADIALRIADAAKAAGIPAPALAAGRPATMPGGDAQQQAMIRGMVDGLAAKLAANPSDLDGWLRLGQAYAVLHEVGKAADAYKHAIALKPGDAAVLQQAAQGMLSNQPATAQITPDELDVLRQLEALTPGQPAVLWYLGLAAAQGGRPGEARAYWGRLVKTLPPDGEEAKTLTAALGALRGD